MARPSKARRSSPRPRTRRTSTRGDVSRVEFAAVVDQLRQHAHHLDIQFRRIADMQADLDEIKRRIKGRKTRR